MAGRFLDIAKYFQKRFQTTLRINLFQFYMLQSKRDFLLFLVIRYGSWNDDFISKRSLRGWRAHRKRTSFQRYSLLQQEFFSKQSTLPAFNKISKTSWIWDRSKASKIRSYNDKYLSIVQAKVSASLPSANEVCEGYVFTGVCLSTGGHAWLLPGEHAWLLQGRACMVALGGHVWLHLGACIVAPGGRVCVVALRGVYMVAPRGHAWLLLGVCVAKGGMCGKGGHAWQRGVCMVKGGHAWQRGGMCDMHPLPTRYSQSLCKVIRVNYAYNHKYIKPAYNK